jgi:hypothetical protein
MDELIVPQPLARVCVQSEQAIGKEIRACAIGSPEIGQRGFGGHIEDSASLVQRKAGPVGRAACCLVRFRWPGMVAVFTGPGDQVKDPAEAARTHIVGTDRARSVRDAAHDVHVLVNRSRRVDDRGRYPTAVSLDCLAEMNRAFLPKASDKLSVRGVERVKISARSREDPLVVAARPVGDTALAAALVTGTQLGGIECPDVLSRRSVQREHLTARGRRIEHPVDNQTVRLELACLAGVVAPDLAQAGDVLLVNLIQRRIMSSGFVAEIDGPVVTLGRRGHRHDRRERERAKRKGIGHLYRYPAPSSIRKEFGKERPRVWRTDLSPGKSRTQHLKAVTPREHVFAAYPRFYNSVIIEI